MANCNNIFYAATVAVVLMLTLSTDNSHSAGILSKLNSFGSLLLGAPNAVNSNDTFYPAVASSASNYLKQQAIMIISVGLLRAAPTDELTDDGSDDYSNEEVTETSENVVINNKCIFCMENCPTGKVYDIIRKRCVRFHQPIRWSR
ncbi:hypothetical protein CHUAL_008806 [Chamberlinius hualienensis]